MRILIRGIVMLHFYLLPAMSQWLSTSPSPKINSDIDGKVLELGESDFEAAIAKFDYLFVAFYAPWCGHCRRLYPELDAAAIVMSRMREPVVVAKLNADKYTHLARKYEVNGFPTLMLFVHGVPVEYRGSRKSDALVRYLKKHVAPDVSILTSELAISEFVEEAGTDFPIIIGFGLNETAISSLAIKRKRRAWFSVATCFSEDVMSKYDFDKVPALILLLPRYDQQFTFYGPFEDAFVDEFIKQNLLPLVVPISHDTLGELKDDERKIVLTIMEDESDQNSQNLIALLKAAAAANRDLVFGFVGVRQWEEFAHTFGGSRNTKLPKMVVWNGGEDYFSVMGVESLEEKDPEAQILQFLHGYREGRTELKHVTGPSLIGFFHSLLGIRSLYVIIFLGAIAVILMLFWMTVGEEEETDAQKPQDKGGILKFVVSARKMEEEIAADRRRSTKKVDG